MKRVSVTSGALAFVLLIQLLLSSVTAFAGAYEPGLQQSAHVFSGQEFYPGKVINAFNTPEDVATWQKGANTKEINHVTSLLNGPGGPLEGEGALEQTPEKVKVYEWRKIYRDFPSPLDLSGERYLAFAANSWGWQPVGYFMKVRLYSGDDVFESIAKISNDRWNRVFIDMSAWDKRNAITRMELSFMQNFDLEGISPGAPGYDFWDGRFQLDYIMATNTIDMLFNREGDAEGFTAHLSSLHVSGGKAALGIEGVDAYIQSPQVQIDAGARNGLSVGLDNQTAAAKVKVAWITEADTTWDDAKSKEFDITPSAAGQTLNANMSDQAGWTGTIKQFRISVPTGEGTLAIDDIRFKNFPPIQKPYDGKITTSAINDNGGITIAGTVTAAYLEQHADEELVLFELPTYGDQNVLAGLTPLAEQSIAEQFTFDISLKDGVHNRLYSKFVVAFRNAAGELTLADAPHYITNAGKLASNKQPFPEAKSIKGLQVQMTDDAEELGISHAAINVSYNEMLYSTNSNPDNTIPYEVDGETFYFQKSYVSHLDSQIKSLSDNDTIVSLILLMYNVMTPGTPNEHLIHPDSQPGGIVYALNTKNELGVIYVKAITTFLADRYSQPDEAHGKAVNFIVGNEVGQNQVWNNMGPKPVGEYVREYAQTLRLVDTIVKSHYANARTYISLDHFWNEELPAEAIWKYDNKAIVDMLNDLAHMEGDFSWNVAFHPYPENLFDPKFWNDATPTDDFNTVRITFKNLQVLVQYLQQQNFLYEGNMRRIILSEQGLNSLSNSENDQLVQAAAYAYAYYKIKFLDGIDSFILHRHVDHAQEGGLNLGLWTYAKNSISTPFEHKTIYDVFKYIDTDQSLAVTDFAKSVIGINDWQDVIPGFDAAKLADREEPAVKGVTFVKKDKKAKDEKSLPLESFENGLGGWQAADNAASATLMDGDAYTGTKSLKVNFSDYAALNWKGADVRFAQPIDASKAPNVTFALKIPDAAADKAYYAKVKVYSGKDIAEGTVVLDPSQGWNHAALNLKGWSGLKAVDRVKVWVSSPGSQSWTGSFLLDDVGFRKNVSPIRDFANIDIEAALLSPQLETGAQIEVKVTNHGDKKLNGKIAIQAGGLIQFDRSELKVNGIKTGESKTYRLTVSAYTPPAEGSVSIELVYGDRSFSQVVDTIKNTGEGIIPANEKLLFNFEGSNQGWTGKENVASVNTVEQFLNGPTKPALGSYTLSARAEAVAADAWKTLAVTPESPIDLTDASELFYHIDSYGGVPGATYETKVTLFSGTESITSTSSMTPDQWNRAGIQVGDWALRNQVTRIEVSFRAVGNNMAWNPEFQLDYMGYIKAGS
ncbi:DUF5722 domain-containing protein [Paenibacillus spongiae]|uniref:DUF5722 domain-containing protein n=1 Tax=Paenibacillus spongiae TaxID=2909671 RepID=A0ABY5SE11_9BACL|nr:DUF5722 domain-containing protein [Paenibacillus spongiae]UVI32014.1 DUF5722 domain-containing protein [Paenibacillus spongiae]